MKFYSAVPDKQVLGNKRIMFFKGGVFETENKKEIEAMKKAKGVSAKAPAEVTPNPNPDPDPEKT